jgi:hypothetical protein
MANTEHGTDGMGVERWWPHLSIKAKHRLLADLDGPIDDETAAEIEQIHGTAPPERLSRAAQEFIRTQVEAVD